MKKVMEILFGPYRYKRTPAAQIDGGAAEYVFQQSQEFPPQNVLAGRGYLYAQDPLLTEQGLFVFAPIGAPYDVTKVPVGTLEIEQPMIEEDLLG